MSPYKHAPLSRHEALVPLSRDHYVGLVQARHLIRAAQADDIERRKVIAAFVDSWDGEIQPHLKDEERLLAHRLGKEDRERLLSEHHALTELAAEARRIRREVSPDAETLDRIGRTLEAHIRWEERELFERVQRDWSEEALTLLQSQTERIESERPRNIHRSSPEPSERDGD